MVIVVICTGISIMTRTEDERIKQNERRINALRMENARLQKKANKRARKIDTRRKIIAGAVILKHAEIDEAFAVELYGLLDTHVSERDRHLFDLPGADPTRNGRGVKSDDVRSNNGPK